MDKAKKLRATERTAVTKCITTLENELGKEPLQKPNIQAALSSLNKHLQKLEDMDEKIKGALLDDDSTTTEALQAECDVIEDYQDRANLIKARVDEALEPVYVPHSPGNIMTSASSVSVTSQNKRNFRLPKIELKKFSGELTEWLGWWSQFKKIDEDDDLHDSDKFHYLDQCMVKGTRAAELVGSFPHSTDNYRKVVEALNRRFGNPKILKQVYVRELISMILANRNKEKLSLASHYDKLESHLRSLESLGVTVEQMVVFLYPMVESSLPEDVLVAWQRSTHFGRDGSQMEPPKSELDFLLDFLKQEIENEEQRKLARGGFAGFSERKSARKKEVTFEDDVPTSAGLFNGSGACAFCDRTGHSTQDCFKAKKMSRDEKKEKLKSKGLCFFCLQSGHMSKQCRASTKCTVCMRRHVTVMCPGERPKLKEVKGTHGTSANPTTQTNLNCTSEVVLRTLILKIQNPTNRKWKRVRVLLDCGSQRSYILKRTAEELGLRPFQSLKMNHQLFGGGRITDVSHYLYKVVLCSAKGSFSKQVLLMDQEQICGTIPRLTLDSWDLELKQKGIVVNDTVTTDPHKIEILIGADLLGSLLTGKLVQLNGGLTATETVFGWCLMGQPREKDRDQLAMTVLSMNVCSASVTDLWKLETLGIRDPIEVKTQEERDILAQCHFRDTVKRNDSGRYSVSLPWIDRDLEIPSNHVVAEKRLESTSRKLTILGKFTDYDAIFKAWEAEGIISRVLELSDSHRSHYLPHRAVLKLESKTTPIRPVFDASCKVGRAPSLNDCLERGPNLLEVIPSILMRFRMKSIGVLADIRKAFLMIEVHEQDRDSMRFLWWENERKERMVIYRHNRVVFGMNCSPFLLGAVINHHLDHWENQHSEVVKEIRNSLYVDNCVLSLDSKQDYQNFKEVSTRIMEDAQMDLRQWECTGDNSAEEVSNVLGLKWDKGLDSLYCTPLTCDVPQKVTKRVILSVVQQIYDPLGFLSPVTLLPKLLLQKSWIENRKWDDEVSEEARTEFLKWWAGIRPLLDSLRIPRKCTGADDGSKSFQLHVFTDASKDAYAAIVFLRVESVKGVSLQLIQAKSRVAPLKTATIPRLELLGCSIGARLLNSVQKALQLENIPVTFWSDSTTALSWIRRSDDWGTFVGNRVREIVKLTDVVNWKHVPGHLNPADLPSRGTTPDRFLELKWWEGPSWLKLATECWPSSEPKTNETEVIQEQKRGTVTMTVQNQQNIWYIRKYSYVDSLRIMALVLRFISKLRKLNCESEKSPSSAEVTACELRLWLLVQRESFSDTETSLNGLKLFKDQDGLLRVKTKVLHRQDTLDFKTPVILPNAHPLVTLLILSEHNSNCHAGAQFLVTNLRERVWILQSRRAVKRTLKKCVTCQRFTSRKMEVPSVALPEDRVKDASAFEVTGIDLAGLLLLHNKSKVWIVLFTCAVYRCVHLEIVESLSTEDFLLAFTRFCKRMRRPEVIYTDNGTNFVGANNLFKQMDWPQIEKRTNQHRIRWNFNPPSAPWWGGWWERLIRSVKDLLKRMMGFAKLSHVQLETCLCEVQAVINNRPLTFVTEDAEDLVPLTPGMFIYNLPLSGTPEDRLLSVENMSGKKKRLDQLLKELNLRFRKEYLGLLVQRGEKKQHRDLKVGDCVLIGREDVKRILWPMGRVVELMPGKDGVNRVAKLKVKEGTLIRPLQRLFLMEFSQEDCGSISVPKKKDITKPKIAEPTRDTTDDESSQIRKAQDATGQGQVQRTRSGRQVRKPLKLTD